MEHLGALVTGTVELLRLRCTAGERNPVASREDEDALTHILGLTPL